MPFGLTKTEVVNAALEMIAAQTQITSINDGSAAADAALVVYDPTVEVMLRELEPDFARFNASLSAFGGTPPSPWSYWYNYPADCIRLLQVYPSAADLATMDPYDPQPILFDVASGSFGGGVQASGSIFFPSNPAPNDTITLNSIIWTFVASGATGNQTNIGGTTAFTIATLRTSLNASTLPGLLVASYANSGGPSTATLTVTYKTAGLAGDTYTLAASAATPSGGALTGGANPGLGTAILSNQATAEAFYISSNVNESQWDAGFTDAVIRRLANPLAMALSGRPDFARELLEEAGKSGAFARSIDESMVVR